MAALASASPDNANPTIHSTAATSGRRSRRRIDSLDLDDDDQWARLNRELQYGNGCENEGSLTAEEFEEQIDSDEIFGQSLAYQLQRGEGADEGAKGVGELY